jgi:Holliday junction resolvase RusA-like endonuclease
MIRFFVPGIPRQEPRKRARRIGTGVQLYTPTDSKVNEWKKAIREIAALSMPLDATSPVWGPDVPLSVFFSFLLPRPKNHYLGGDESRGLSADGRRHMHHLSKPDVDNLAKAAMDALGEWPKGDVPLLWGDDRQVVGLECMKSYTVGPGTGLEVRVEPLSTEMEYGGSRTGEETQGELDTSNSPTADNV